MINKISHQFVWLLAVGTALSGGAAGQAINQSASESRTVIINRVRLTNEQITALEQRFQIRLQEGSFWYDKMTGAWGLEGGPGLGLGVAGLNLGGPLRADSSKGNTKVFINGRELHWFDVAVLQQLGPVYRGRYWVDAYGNCGIEGGPFLFNLVAVARAKAQAQGGGNGRSRANGNSWIGSDSNGKMFGQFKDPLGNSHIFGQ